MKLVRPPRLVCLLLPLFSVSGCATLQGVARATGAGLEVKVTNALSIPVCQVDVVYGDKTKEGLMKSDLTPLGVMQNPLQPGQTAFVIAPDFDSTQVPTFDLAAHACASTTGMHASEGTMATVRGLKSSDIGHRYRDEAVVLH